MSLAVTNRGRFLALDSRRLWLEVPLIVALYSSRLVRVDVSVLDLDLSSSDGIVTIDWAGP